MVNTGFSDHMFL